MSGRFIAAMPVSVLTLNADLFFLKRLPIEVPMPPWPVAVVMLKNRTLSPVVERFVECARDTTRSMGLCQSNAQSGRGRRSAADRSSLNPA
jgi:DNA-binding transcriptional LysR family regulator